MPTKNLALQGFFVSTPFWNGFGNTVHNILSTKTLQNEKLTLFNRSDPCNRVDLWIFRLPCWWWTDSHSFSNCSNCCTFRYYKTGIDFFVDRR